MVVFIKSAYTCTYISGSKIPCNDDCSVQGKSINFLYTGLRQLHLSCIETFGRNVDCVKAELLSYF